MSNTLARCACLLLCLSSLAAPRAASARVASTTLGNLASTSRAIAVVHVDAVREVGGLEIATATVVRPLAGLQQGQRFAFLAQGTRACDSSDAVPDETVLLFVEEPE